MLCLLSLGAPLITGAEIRITEIMYDPSGADTKREWIEIYNSGTVSIDLSKFKFTDKSNHVLNAPPKNGGVGSVHIAPDSYAVLASDATTFVGAFPSIANVIDTAMSLNNTGATISILSGTAIVNSASYTKSAGGAGNGDSLQLHNGAWIHARPTPNGKNATASSVQATVKAAAKPAKTTKKKTKKPTVVVTDAEAEELNDPHTVVNATATDVMAQSAAVGSLGGSMWWFVAAALALSTGAIASLISHSKKREWDIEESE